MLQFLTTGAV